MEGPSVQTLDPRLQTGISRVSHGSQIQLDRGRPGLALAITPGLEALNGASSLPQTYATDSYLETSIVFC